jgi:hypothetical protein
MALKISDYDLVAIKSKSFKLFKEKSDGSTLDYLENNIIYIAVIFSVVVFIIFLKKKNSSSVDNEKNNF